MNHESKAFKDPFANFFFPNHNLIAIKVHLLITMLYQFSVRQFWLLRMFNEDKMVHHISFPWPTNS